MSYLQEWASVKALDMGIRCNFNLHTFFYTQTSPPIHSGRRRLSAAHSHSMKALKRLWYTACAAMLCLCLLPACGDSNGDEPDNPNPINPDKEVADPAGTVKLSMRSEAAAGDNKTVLDRGEYDRGLYIDGADNFSTSGYIVDIGSVKGLGNIGYIPKSGYAQKTAVTPGHGYVWARCDGESWLHGYDGYSGYRVYTYYRIYVTNYVKNAIGEIIGADIKYQKGFNGIDETLKPTEETMLVDPSSREATITFDNSTVTPFLLECDDSQIYLYPYSTQENNDNGPYSQIKIWLNGDYRACFGIGFKSSFSIKTLYGKTTKIIIQSKI